MKKLYFLFILFVLCYSGFSQNQFPAAKGSHVLIDGGQINMIRPGTTGGWARGLNYIKPDNIRYAGIGILGGGDEIKHLYIAHGSAPWDSKKGIYILPDGNVGIGTSNPTRKLDVVGDIKSDTRIIVSNPESPASSVHLGWLNNVARIRIGGSGNGAGNGVDIQTQGDKSLMRLLHNGNVGIGTTSPDSRLSVNGVVHSKEVKVDLNGWSDFVFAEGYELPALEEVEQHIREKGHLKDIPSAKQVEENGIFLGEMDAKLLQKIEELTLYAIQQQKQIELILEENQQLRKEIDELKKP
ncbi:hypothetical protein [Sinomicrobium sp. M5D2P9]